MDAKGEIIILYAWFRGGGVVPCILFSDRGRKEKEVCGYIVDGKTNNVNGEEVDGKASNRTPPVCLYRLRIKAK